MTCTNDADEVWYIGEPIPVKYVGLRLTPSSPYINDAVLTVQMKRDGEDVGTSATLDNVTTPTQSNGDYEGAVPGSATALFVEGNRYDLWITSPNLVSRKLSGVARQRGR